MYRVDLLKEIYQICERAYETVLDLDRELDKAQNSSQLNKMGAGLLRTSFKYKAVTYAEELHARLAGLLDYLKSKKEDVDIELPEILKIDDKYRKKDLIFCNYWTSRKPHPIIKQNYEKFRPFLDRMRELRNQAKKEFEEADRNMRM